MADLPAEIREDPDAVVHYIGRLMNWPELAAKGRPPKPSPPATPTPDSPDFSAPSDSAAFPEENDEADLPPFSPEELAEWRTWAAVSDRLRDERPSEPWWGQAVAVDPERDAAAIPLAEEAPS